MPLTQVQGQMLSGSNNTTTTIQSNGTTAITIDSSQNVGIGTSTTTDTKLRVKQSADTGAASFSFKVEANANDTGLFIGYRGVGAATAADTCAISASYASTGAFKPITFLTSDAERMRILSDGGIAIGKTVVSVTTNGVGINPNGQGTGIPALGMGSASNSNSFIGYGMYYNNNVNQWQFYVDWSGVIWARSTTISGLSDRNEKENIRELETGINEVMQLKPKRFDWKDGSKQDLVGFIAQDVQEVLPDLVENYRVEEGQEPRLALRMGDILPTLVKAIQELKAELDATKAEVAELKAKGQ